MCALSALASCAATPPFRCCCGQVRAYDKVLYWATDKAAYAQSPVDDSMDYRVQLAAMTKTRTAAQARVTAEAEVKRKVVKAARGGLPNRRAQILSGELGQSEGGGSASVSTSMDATAVDAKLVKVTRLQAPPASKGDGGGKLIHMPRRRSSCRAAFNKLLRVVADVLMCFVLSFSVPSALRMADGAPLFSILFSSSLPPVTALEANQPTPAPARYCSGAAHGSALGPGVQSHHKKRTALLAPEGGQKNKKIKNTCRKQVLGEHVGALCGRGELWQGYLARYLARCSQWWLAVNGCRLEASFFVYFKLASYTCGCRDRFQVQS